MSRPTHTPGPWYYDPSAGVYAAGQPIAHCDGRRNHDVRPQECVVCADGRLIAAAPAFLSACTHERDTVSRLDWLSALLDQCDRNFAGLLGEDGDRDALYTAYSESCRLLTDLRAAVVQARGEAPNG